jgi:fermentation-respiration switch protein FrsA (DUF1100 family)
MKRVQKVLLGLVIAYAVILVLLVAFEKRLVFFPQVPGRLTGDWQPAGLHFEDVWLRTQDAVRLHAWWIPAAGEKGHSAEPPLTYLVFHGNAANIAWRADVYRFLRALPANVLAVEYRGYGRSEGAPSEEGLYRDADAAYDYLVRERGVYPVRMVVLGQSLGTAVAADLASRREVGGVVLEAPFPSARAVARRIYWFLPGLSLVVRTRLDVSGKLAQPARPGVPLLVIHCTADPVIPFEMGREVFNRAPEPKSFAAIQGDGHEEAFLMDPGILRAELLRFAGQVRARTRGGS